MMMNNNNEKNNERNAMEMQRRRRRDPMHCLEEGTASESQQAKNSISTPVATENT